MDMRVITESSTGDTIIKVIGCGGGGGNAINRMVEDGVKGVEFITANTDLQVLNKSLAPIKIPLGTDITKGLGAGGDPGIGEKAAEEDKENIKNYLQGTDMVFITAGMGGGTGTGAAPVIARIAKEMGCLTVGVVTTPFRFEGKKKIELAEAGIEKLRKYADTVIPIPNAKLLESVEAHIGMNEAFRVADQVLKMGVQGISDIITHPGIMNIDFADVRNIMEGKGQALMGMGRAEGENRSIEAAKRALAHPLLNGMSVKGAQGLLVSINSGEEISIGEFDEIMEYFGKQAGSGADTKGGCSIVEELGSSILVTVIATGFNASSRHEPTRAVQRKVPQQEQSQENTSQSEGKKNLSFAEWNKIRNERGLHASLPPSHGNDLTGNNPLFPPSDIGVPAYLRDKARNEKKKEGDEHN